MYTLLFVLTLNLANKNQCIVMYQSIFSIRTPESNKNCTLWMGFRVAKLEISFN